MPTYTNETEVNQKFIVQDKSIKTVVPGETFITPYFTSNVNLTLDSKTSYYNRTVTVGIVTTDEDRNRRIITHDKRKAPTWAL
jgi:hypothetical protein